MSIYEFKIKTRQGENIELSKFKGKVLLIVNTATGCGFTPQYEAIENLYEKYHERGFEVLDFPCDQFGHQAPGDDNEIHEFCVAKYKTQFDQFAKIDVNGENEIPLYAHLKKAQPVEEIRGLKNKMAMKAVSKISTSCKKPGDIVWNFTKFLVDRNGNVIKRYDPTFNPSGIEPDLIKLI